MKRFRRLLFAFILTFFITTFSYAQGQTARVRVTPETIQVPEGGAVDVVIDVQDIQDLFAFDILLTFDPDVVQVVDADPELDGVQVNYGLFLEPGFVLRNTADNQAGRIHFALTQLNPSPPKTGSGNLIVITFRGQAVNRQSQLSFEKIKLVRQDGSQIDVDTRPGEINVVGTATPGPTNTPVPTQDPGTPLPTTAPPTRTPYRSPTSTQPGSTRTSTITASPTSGESPSPTMDRESPTNTLTPESSPTPGGGTDNEEQHPNLSNEEIAQTIAAMVPTETPSEGKKVFQTPIGKAVLYVIGSAGLLGIILGGYWFTQKLGRENENGEDSFRE